MVLEKYSENYVNQVLVRIATDVQIDILDSTASFMTLTATGGLADLAPYLNADPTIKLSDMPELAWQNFSNAGRIYGIPTQIFPVAVVYNRSWFDEAGLAPLRQMGEEWNWQTAKQYAARLTTDTNGDGKIDRYGLYFTRALNRVHAAVHQAGGDLYERYLQPTKALFNSPGAYTGLSFYVDLAVSGNATYEAGFADIYTQRAAAINLDGQPSNYNLYLIDSADDFEVALQPLGPVRRGANMFFGPLHVVKSNRDVEPMWRWIKFLTFDTESQIKMMHATARLPVHLPTLARLEQYVAPYDSKQAAWMLAFREVGIHPDNAPSYFTGADSKINTIFNAEFLKALRGDEALRTVLDRVNPLIQQELDALQLAD